MRVTSLVLLAPLCLPTVLSLECLAQWGDNTVSGTGTAAVQLTPTRLRMQMPLRAYGTTPEFARIQDEARIAHLAERLLPSGATVHGPGFAVSRWSVAATHFPTFFRASKLPTRQ